MELPLSPIPKITDYQSMLRRIAIYSFITGGVATFVLRKRSPQIDAVLSYLDINIEADVGPFKKIRAAGYLLPAIAIAILSYGFRLHDWISYFLGIRYL